MWIHLGIVHNLLFVILLSPAYICNSWGRFLLSQSLRNYFFHPVFLSSIHPVLAIVLFDLLQFMDSDCPFGIFKLSLIMQFFAKCSDLCFFWYIEFLFFFHFNVVYLLNDWCGLFVEWLCWELSVVCRRFSAVVYHFREKLDWKRQKSANFQNLKVFIFHPILMQFFLWNLCSF